MYKVKTKIEAAAHPRSRGEHSFASLRALFTVGSSPLARGTLQEAFAKLRDRRLIPARAGNIRKQPAKKNI